jgi:hypothetical protein
MQNSIVFCAENPSLKNDKTPIKRQRSKVKTECKAREKKKQHPNPSNAGNLAPHIIQAANRLAAPAPLFSEYVLANIKNTNNLVRLRIEEDVRVSNSFNEKRASIGRSIIRSKLPMQKRQVANQRKQKPGPNSYTTRPLSTPNFERENNWDVSPKSNHPRHPTAVLVRRTPKVSDKWEINRRTDKCRKRRPWNNVKTNHASRCIIILRFFCKDSLSQDEKFMMHH